MRVVHVVPFIGEEASGPSHSVPGLCEALAGRGVDVTLHVLGPAPKRARSFRLVEHERARLLPNLGFSPGLAAALREEARVADVLHNHSLWMVTNVYPAVAVRGTRCRLVTSPRGTLGEGAMHISRRKKQIFWLLGQKEVVHQAACLHATAESEYDDIRRAGLRNPVAIVPNGVHMPEGIAEQNRALPRRMLFLGRVHPIKAVDQLLRAWASLEREFPDWVVEVIGPPAGTYGEEMRALARELGLRRVMFHGAAYGAEKNAAYRRADLFVLPTLSENFGMSVAEALSYGVPAVVSRGAPWRVLETERCGWWHEVGVEPLGRSLREALSTPPAELAEMGARGRRYVERELSWPGVAEKMERTYAWLLGGGPAPEWVRVT